MKKITKNAEKKSFIHKFKNFSVISRRNTFIEKGAQIGENCVIYPNVYIDKNCKIGENCIIYNGTILKNTEIKNDTIIYSYCVLDGCKAGSCCRLGPFLHTREKTVIGNGVRLGNFCETKNAEIDDNTKIAHLSYVGDATIGKNCNFGCGTVFANYDGEKKMHSTVKNGCFIGCNANIVAPAEIGENVFVAAGTTVTKTIKSNTFVIGRPEIKQKPNKKLK